MNNHDPHHYGLTRKPMALAPAPDFWAAASDYLTGLGPATVS